MPLSDFRDTYAWREAIELSPFLVNLAEQLPASEEHGLSLQLRQIMVRLPGAIAYDLGESSSFSRKLHITRLAAILDIIDKVYPALDTAGARKSLEKLVDRVAGPGFGEQTPGAAKVYMPGAMSHLRPEPGTNKAMPSAESAESARPGEHSEQAVEEVAEHAAAVEPVPAHVEPSTVPVTPAEEPSAATHVQVNADVHPDSE